jgi:dephospho-CoA kinase
MTPAAPRRVLVTGMSGTGKSTVLDLLGRRGRRVVDTDSEAWSHWVRDERGEPDWVWREDAMTELLSTHREGTLFVAGCKSNQGRFYPWFDEVVLLSAPVQTLLARIAERRTNDYGKDPAELALVLEHLRTVEPLLRRTATVEIDTTVPVEDVVRQLESLM